MNKAVPLSSPASHRYGSLPLVEAAAPEFFHPVSLERGAWERLPFPPNALGISSLDATALRTHAVPRSGRPPFDRLLVSLPRRASFL